VSWPSLHFADMAPEISFLKLVIRIDEQLKGDVWVKCNQSQMWIAQMGDNQANPARGRSILSEISHIPEKFPAKNWVAESIGLARSLTIFLYGLPRLVPTKRGWGAASVSVANLSF